MLTIIVPCYNECKTIEYLIDAVNRADPLEKEIILVDDCSTDGTQEIIKSLYDAGRVQRAIFHNKNLGKGAAINSASKYINGHIVIIQDADLEYDPREYLNLINPIIDDKADVVYGSRFMGGRPHRVAYFWHRVGNGFLTLLSNMMTNLNLTDMETCYKAFRFEVFNKIQLEESRFGFEPEITAKISKMNCRIYEVGISYYGRTYTEGKKIGWKDGIAAIKCIIKYNLFR